MPTGYTAAITEKGLTFEQYAMNCARAFGALVMLRDDPLDAPIPEEFKPSDYHVRAYKDAVAEVERLSKLAPDEQDAWGMAQKEKAVTSAKESLAREAADNAKYAAMREQVAAWEPPTKDHVELKSFMLQQIDISTHDLGYMNRYIGEVEARTPHSYYCAALEAATRGLAYHTEQNEKEKERAKGRTEWVQQLRKSLSDLTPATSKSATADEM